MPWLRLCLAPWACLSLSLLRPLHEHRTSDRTCVYSFCRYQEFVKGVDQPMLFDLVTAANFMAIRKCNAILFLETSVYSSFTGTTFLVFQFALISFYPCFQEPLLDLTCLQVSCQLMGKSAEEIRVILNIPKLTAEEEAKARQEHRWVFDD